MSRASSGTKRRRVVVGIAAFVIVALSITVTALLAQQASNIRWSLTQAGDLAPVLKAQILKGDQVAAERTAGLISEHTGAASAAAGHPIWKAATNLPGIGDNFSAVSEIAQSADDVVRGAVIPLVRVAKEIKPEAFMPVRGKLDLKPLSENASALQSASSTIQLTAQRLEQIDESSLEAAVSAPLDRVRSLLGDLAQPVQMAADASALLPTMLGDQQPRNYLLLIQNNAEIRSTGGLPGALAVLHADRGRVSLKEQSTGAAIGRFAPPISVPQEQISIYSSRLGSFIGDVNLTPDFPTAALTAKKMWETRFKTPISGVIAIDPVVLSHLLRATGPVEVTSPAQNDLLSGLPTSLSVENVVEALLSRVYQSTDDNAAQDDYFAAVSESVFQKLTTSDVDGAVLIDALTKSVAENRLHAWSALPGEQEVIRRTALGGAISGPNAPGAAFGVYFNDGTGSKMDYYVRREIELIQECPRDGYNQFTVRVRLHNTAPSDAGTILPTAVTGGGRFGTPAGSVQTNTVVYGPAQGLIDTVVRDGKKVSFGSHVHGQRPVGVISTRLSPGASTELKFHFVKVVQTTQPRLTATPTIQPVKDVVLPVRMTNCSKVDDKVNNG